MLQGQIIGNLGEQAEIKEHNGNRFITFNVAVNNSYKDSTGAKVQQTTWVNCVASETGVTPYLVKGQQVFVEGDIKAESYQSKKDGKYYAKLKMRAYKIQLVGGKPDNGAADQPATRPAAASAAPAPPPVTTPNVPGAAASLGGFGSNTDDDLPF